MNGKEFFLSTKDDVKSRGSQIANKVDEVFSWESESVSENSPGPVDSKESLIRALDQPTHWNRATKEYTPTAFNDAWTMGLSVYRHDFCELEAVKNISDERVVGKMGGPAGNKEQRVVIGFTIFLCEELRSLRSCESPNNRVAVVLDTANDVKLIGQAHADIFILPQESKLKKRIRSQLFEMAKERLYNRDGKQCNGEEISRQVESSS